MTYVLSCGKLGKSVIWLEISVENLFSEVKYQTRVVKIHIKELSFKSALHNLVLVLYNLEKKQSSYKFPFSLTKH